MGGEGGEDRQSRCFAYTAKLNSRSECPSDQPEAAAQRSGSGFMETQAEPRPPKALKLARPGLAYIGPGLAGLTASGRAGTTLATSHWSHRTAGAGYCAKDVRTSASSRFLLSPRIRLLFC